MAGKVKCNDCGLLAIRNHEKRAWEEVDSVIRLSGRPPNFSTFDQCPACLIGMASLHSEAKDLGIKEFAKAVVAVLNHPRDCAGFVAWQQSFTPKAHREMQHIEEQRKRDQEQRDRDRAWQEDRRKVDLAWQASQEDKAENRWQREHGLQRSQLVFVGIFGTIILAITQLIGSCIQANASKEQPPIIINVPPKSATQP